jgi:hypothetical protein
MTEQDLINEGFEKVIISDDESQNGFDYYYYQKEVCENIVLHSTDNVDVVDDKWQLRTFDIPAILISELGHYKEFMELMSNIVC